VRAAVSPEMGMNRDRRVVVAVMVGVRMQPGGAQRAGRHRDGQEERERSASHLQTLPRKRERRL